MNRRQRGIVFAIYLASLGCAAESTPPVEIEESKANLVIEPNWVWDGRVSDVCFMTGGGPITLIGTDNKCIRKPATGNVVQLYTCDGSAAQAFTVELDYTLRMGGKCLQPVAGGTADMTKVELATCNGSEAQKWHRTIGDRIPIAFVNNAAQRCLNVSARSNLTQIDIRNCACTVADASQSFTVPAAGTAGPITTSDGKCAHVVGDSAVAGTAVELVACDGSAAQTWTANAARTTFQALGKCLQTGADNRITIGDCNGGAGQTWAVNSSGSLGTSAGSCLNKPTAGANELQQLVVKYCNGDPVAEQLWDIPDQPVSPAHRRLVRDAITNTWVAMSQLELRYWDTCPADLSTLVNPVRIRSRMDMGRTAGKEGGTLILNHAMVPVTLDHGNQDWNRGGAIHEFGHLLGFPHEQQRHDNQDSHFCDAEGDNPDQIDFGLYDPESIMNYCGVQMPTNETEVGYVNLSRNDMMGMQRAVNAGGSAPYGERANRREIWRSGTYRETAFPQSAAGYTLLPGQGWSSVDDVVELRFATDGTLGVYRTDLYLHNKPEDHALPPIWQATDAAGVPVIGTSAAFAPTGQLVVYNGGAAVWSAPEAPLAGATLAIQHDANVVIRGADGLRVWDTNTPHRDLLAGAVGLMPGAALAAGASKTTKSGRFALSLTSDGDLQVIDHRATQNPIWHSNTAGRGITQAKMMLNGTLQLLAGETQVKWTAPFVGKPATFLALQDEGDLIAYEPAKYEVWHLGGVNACLENWRSLPGAQTCLRETQSDRAQCKLFLDCYYNYGCGPNTCGNPDDVCGVNVLKSAGSAPKTIADQAYLAMGCSPTTNTAVPKAGALVPTFDSPPVRLWNNTMLSPGQSVSSSTGRSALTLRSDGKLAFLVNGATRWVSSSAGVVGGLDRSGDLVVRDASGKNTSVSSTDSYMNAYVAFSDAGILSIYRTVTNGADNIGFEF